MKIDCFLTLFSSPQGSFYWYSFSKSFLHFLVPLEEAGSNKHKSLPRKYVHHQSLSYSGQISYQNSLILHILVMFEALSAVHKIHIQECLKLSAVYKIYIQEWAKITGPSFFVSLHQVSAFQLCIWNKHSKCQVWDFMMERCTNLKPCSSSFAGRDSEKATTGDLSFTCSCSTLTSNSSFL